MAQKGRGWRGNDERWEEREKKRDLSVRRTQVAKMVASCIPMFLGAGFFPLYSFYFPFILCAIQQIEDKDDYQSYGSHSFLPKYFIHSNHGRYK